MNSKSPIIVMRLGTHAEKDYVLRTHRNLGGLMVGANLLEGTPGATTSLLIKHNDIGYYIDPMTHAFGPYYDRNDDIVRRDLDWIKSEQLRQKIPVREIKRSYLRLAERYGGSFQASIDKKISIEPVGLSHDSCLEIAKSVVGYQISRLALEFQQDPLLQTLADSVPLPKLAFAPYFYVEPRQFRDIFATNLALIEASKEVNTEEIGAIFCFDHTVLKESSEVDYIISGISKVGIKKVWLWFSRFDEHVADVGQLSNYTRVVRQLAENGKDVYSLHGGYYSLCLSFVGLKGISHGVGYGEQKDVMPVIGQSIPTVRYYVPPVHKKMGLAELQRCMASLHIDTSKLFKEAICDCAICSGVIQDDVRNLKDYFDQRLASVTSKRPAQTPEAAKKSRYHYLFSRFKEVKILGQSSYRDILKELECAEKSWGKQPAVDLGHLSRWLTVLRSI